MTAPNIARVKQILSKNTTVISGVTPTNVVSNPVNSYKVLKVNQLIASNPVFGFVNLTVAIFRNSTAYRFLPTVSVPPFGILEALSKPIYLEEGDSLQVTGALEVSVSYEQMTDVI